MASIELMDRSDLLNALYQQLELDPSRAAVVAVDLNRRFLDPAMSPLPEAVREGVVASSRRFLTLARERGFPVIHVLTGRRPIELDIMRRNAIAVGAGLQLSPTGALDLTPPDWIEGQWQPDIMPELGPVDGDYIIRNKKTYSAFYGTDLYYLLRTLKVTTVVLIGINSNTTLQSTAADAIDLHGLEVVVIPECCASVHGSDLHDLAIENFARCLGCSLSIEQFQAKLDHQDGKLSELPRIDPLGKRSVEIIDRADYLAAMKDQLQVDPRRTAVIQIDMHRRQIDPRWAPFPAELGDPLLERTGRFLQRCRDEGLPVIQIMVNRRPVEDVEAGRFQKTAACGSFRSPYGPDLPYDCGAKEGQFTWDIMPQLGPAPTDYIINSKKTGSCYHYTDLEILLRALQVDTLIITGINTNTCVTKCALDSANRGLRAVVISDCVDSSYGPDMHLGALENIARSFGWVLTAEEFAEKLRPALVGTPGR